MEFSPAQRSRTPSSGYNIAGEPAASSESKALVGLINELSKCAVDDTKKQKKLRGEIKQKVKEITKKFTKKVDGIAFNRFEKFVGHFSKPRMETHREHRVKSMISKALKQIAKGKNTAIIKTIVKLSKESQPDPLKRFLTTLETNLDDLKLNDILSSALKKLPADKYPEANKKVSSSLEDAKLRAKEQVNKIIKLIISEVKNHKEKKETLLRNESPAIRAFRAFKEQKIIPLFSTPGFLDLVKEIPNNSLVQQDGVGLVKQHVETDALIHHAKKFMIFFKDFITSKLEEENTEFSEFIRILKEVNQAVSSEYDENQGKQMSISGLLFLRTLVPILFNQAAKKENTAEKKNLITIASMIQYLANSIYSEKPSETTKEDDAMEQLKKGFSNDNAIKKVMRNIENTILNQ